MEWSLGSRLSVAAAPAPRLRRGMLRRDKPGAGEKGQHVWGLGACHACPAHAMIAVDADSHACLGLVGGDVQTRDGVMTAAHRDRPLSERGVEALDRDRGAGQACPCEGGGRGRVNHAIKQRDRPFSACTVRLKRVWQRCKGFRPWVSSLEGTSAEWVEAGLHGGARSSGEHHSSLKRRCIKVQTADINCSFDANF
jgi:hypothetical protein